MRSNQEPPRSVPARVTVRHWRAHGPLGHRPDRTRRTNAGRCSDTWVSSHNARTPPPRIRSSRSSRSSRRHCPSPSHSSGCRRPPPAPSPSTCCATVTCREESARSGTSSTRTSSTGTTPTTPTTAPLVALPPEDRGRLHPGVPLLAAGSRADASLQPRHAAHRELPRPDRASVLPVADGLRPARSLPPVRPGHRPGHLRDHPRPRARGLAARRAAAARSGDPRPVRRPARAGLRDLSRPLPLAAPRLHRRGDRPRHPPRHVDRLPRDRPVPGAARPAGQERQPRRRRPPADGRRHAAARRALRP